MRLYDDVPLRKICKSWWFDVNGSTASDRVLIVRLLADSCQFILCVGFKVLDYYPSFSLPVHFYDNMSRLYKVIYDILRLYMIILLCLGQSH